MPCRDLAACPDFSHSYEICSTAKLNIVHITPKYLVCMSWIAAATSKGTPEGFTFTVLQTSVW
jgi:hypothetical protein